MKFRSQFKQISRFKCSESDTCQYRVLIPDILCIGSDQSHLYFEKPRKAVITDIKENYAVHLYVICFTDKQDKQTENHFNKLWQRRIPNTCSTESNTFYIWRLHSDLLSQACCFNLATFIFKKFYNTR